MIHFTYLKGSYTFIHLCKCFIYTHTHNAGGNRILTCSHRKYISGTHAKDCGIVAIYWSQNKRLTPGAECLIHDQLYLPKEEVQPLWLSLPQEEVQDPVKRRHYQVSIPEASVVYLSLCSNPACFLLWALAGTAATPRLPAAMER